MAKREIYDSFMEFRLFLVTFLIIILELSLKEVLLFLLFYFKNISDGSLPNYQGLLNLFFLS